MPAKHRQVHPSLRAQPRIEEITIVLDSNALDRFFGELCSFLGHLLFGGVQPPKRHANHPKHDNEQNNDLSG